MDEALVIVAMNSDNYAGTCYMYYPASSREAIYYRIHKLAYGDSWNYDYEEFVEWDARNRAASGVKRVPGFKPANYRPTHPPVVVKKSWKE